MYLEQSDPENNNNSQLSLCMGDISAYWVEAMIISNIAERVDMSFGIGVRIASAHYERAVWSWRESEWQFGKCGCDWEVSALWYKSMNISDITEGVVMSLGIGVLIASNHLEVAFWQLFSVSLSVNSIRCIEAVFNSQKKINWNADIMSLRI